MVSLPTVLSSNAQIPNALPRRLVAVFTGVTSGIGEATLLSFVKYTIEPRIYLFARNPESAARVIAACRRVNPEGEYEFIKVDLSSIKETDAACEVVLGKEKTVNFVLLSAGEIRFELTPEGLNKFLAASTYTRILIAQKMLPLLSTAGETSPLARVIDVAGGTKEGDMNLSDLEAKNIPLTKMRPQLTSMHTLALESLAMQAPNVTFVHDFPGSVETELWSDVPGGLAAFVRVVKAVLFFFFAKWLFVPIEECAERHVFFATSARYPPREGKAKGLEVKGETEVAKGSDGRTGSGVYSVDWDGEGPGEAAETALNSLRERGVREVVWNHLMELFEKVRLA